MFINIRDEVIEDMPVTLPHLELDAPPTKEELAKLECGRLVDPS